MFCAGKYTLSNKPGGPRAAAFNDDRIRAIQPLLGLLKEIGKGKGDKSAAQVAINWVISKGDIEGFTAIPILGEPPMIGAVRNVKPSANICPPIATNHLSTSLD